jgi:predicted NUDIX family NTP pyrophosphohydrolase
VDVGRAGAGHRAPGLTVAAKRSAGLLLHRTTPGGVVEVLIGHMGGPFWARKDDGGWSIPKGEYEPGEDPFAVALREFEEELGSPCPAGSFAPLGEVRQPSGKVLTVWATEGDLDATTARSNTFEMEWPRGSGRIQAFPEIDRAAWFPVEAARSKLLKGQVAFLDRLLEHLAW